jgi:predicted Zn-dependent peptidase
MRGTKYYLFIWIFCTQILALQATEPPKVVQYTLPNGFTVFLCEDHSQQKIFGTIVCKAGSKNDPKGATGVAHYQEHMLFKGTTELGTTNWEAEKPHIDSVFALYDLLGNTKDENIRLDIQHLINNESLAASKFAIPNEMSNLIKSMGSDDLNAETNADITVFYNSIPPNQLGRWLDLYSHRFTNPVFRSFQSELEVVYEEKNRRLDNYSTIMKEKFLSQFFKYHPYGQQTTLGTIEDLKNPSLTKMFQFFKAYYVANNMGLILVGDFNPDSVRQDINEKFGKWPRGPIPEKTVYEELPFKGREFAEGNFSPVDIGIFGFRTVPKGHPDEVSLDIISSLLTNQNQTGLLDKLVIENKLLASQLIPLPFNDLNGTAIAIVPRLDHQELNEAEGLLLKEIDKIKKGEFETDLLNSVKYDKYREFQLSLENFEKKAMLIAESFGRNQDIMENLNYPERIKAVSREEVVQVANKYFGSNYLAFYSHKGTQPKEKIDKPKFKPIIVNTNKKSKYANYFETIPLKKVNISFIDFSKDVLIDTFGPRSYLHYVPNPVNDIFNLTLKFGAGTEQLSKLFYAAQLLNYSGVDGKNLFQFKESLSKIGCAYDVTCDRSYFYIHLQGLDMYFDEAVGLISGLLTNPNADKERITILHSNAMAAREIEKKEPNSVASALLEKAIYLNKSIYINRLSLEEIKSLNADSLIADVKKATQYELDVHYVGQLPFKIVSAKMKYSFGANKNRLSSKSPVIRKTVEFTENYVYVTHMKNARQSKIYFFCNGRKSNKSIEPYSEAFNFYFGGDFSGLVMQEIREYRSLAYTVGAEFKLSPIINGQTSFEGFVGTQSDKTINVIDTYMGLLHEMPLKPDNMEIAKSFLLQSAISSKPGFRQISEKVEEWKQQGYKQDPLIDKLDIYKNMTFDDVVNFYNINIKTQPFVIAIVGDFNKIDAKQLSHFGKVVIVMQNDLYTK